MQDMKTCVSVCASMTVIRERQQRDVNGRFVVCRCVLMSAFGGKVLKTGGCLNLTLSQSLCEDRLSVSDEEKREIKTRLFGCKQ